MFLYYITDRTQFCSDPAESTRLLLERVREAAEAGVDAIQLREKDLTGRQLTELGRRVVETVANVNGGKNPPGNTRVLINSRTDVTIACGAHGVHLRSNDVSPADARAVLLQAGVARPIVGVSCHSPREVELAAGSGADFCVFSPVFEKHGARAAGLDSLQQACMKVKVQAGSFAVLALGGVSTANAADCLRAGAAGIAGIRLFQAGNLKKTVERLRSL